MKLFGMNCCIFPVLAVIFLFPFRSCSDAIDESIEWRPYSPRHLKVQLKNFYTFTWDALIQVPLEHPNKYNEYRQTEDANKSFQIYVRRFSRVRDAKKHLWLISGGPGSSTSGIERALNILLPDTAIYIMDNRGLGHSNRLCHHSDGAKCQKNPKVCYEALKFPPRYISMHETAQDYNFVSRKLKESYGGDVFMYGSSYGATLAYSSFKFDTKLYAGLLLEAFVPEFRLNGDVDVRRHVVRSCFQSETCKSALNSISEDEAVDLMKRIMDQKIVNPCKSSISFLAGQSGHNVNSFLNSYIRVALYKKTMLRPAIIPLLYSIAYCPSVGRFNRLLSDFHAANLGSDESGDVKSSSVSTTGLHCSLTPNTNDFFGSHIRYSEYSHDDSEGRFEVCQKQKFLSSSNWADVCGMVSDYNDAFTPYLYEPLVPLVTVREAMLSPTRLVVVTGKLDTQTPHDLAAREFSVIPLREKYLFTADHAGHGVIDSWEVPGLSLDVMLSFTMYGRDEDLRRLRAAIASHNLQAELIWRTWNRDVFGGRDIWNLRVEADGDLRYWWWGFWTFLSICLLGPMITFILSSGTTDEEDSKDTSDCCNL